MVNTISTHDNACGRNKHRKCRCKVCVLADISKHWDNYPDGAHVAYTLTTMDYTSETDEQDSVVCSSNTSKKIAIELMKVSIDDLSNDVIKQIVTKETENDDKRRKHNDD